MDVQLTPEVQARLDRIAHETGRPSNELVEDALIAYLDEIAQLREMLDERYDDLDHERVTPIDGEQAYQRLIEKTAERRRRPA